MNKKGFTLLELLLGMVLLAVVGTLVTSVFWTGMKMMRQRNNKDAVYQQVRWALQIMSLEVEQMVPFEMSVDENETGIFKALDDELQFLYRGRNGLEVVRYRSVSPDQTRLYEIEIRQATKRNVAIQTGTILGADQVYFVRESMLLKDYLSSKSDWNEKVFIKDVERGSIEFSYPQGNSGSDLEWFSSWSDMNFPKVIKLEFNLLAETDDEFVTVPIEKVFHLPHGIVAEENNEI